jgi:IS30 family transposase
MQYTQLTQEQRYQISVLKKMGHSQTEIAECVGVHKSTISRELRRNRGQRGYRPKQAHRKAQNRRARNSPQISEKDWQIVEEKLKMDWSPEQISSRLKRLGKVQISHESIYQHIYADKRAGGELYKHLRQQKKRRKRRSGRDLRGKITDRVSIEERPAVVEHRSRLGDWEVDLIIGSGHKGAVVTLTERKSRFTLLRHVASKSADLVGQTVIELLNWVPCLKTITADNGKEFAKHQKISTLLRLDFFFAHPYASWERGTNENTNGLIRQYFPKTRDLSSVKAQEECFVMNRLNMRPRKCLDYLTPYEVFFNYSPVALRC